MKAEEVRDLRWQRRNERHSKFLTALGFLAMLLGVSGLIILLMGPELLGLGLVVSGGFLLVAVQIDERSIDREVAQLGLEEFQERLESRLTRLEEHFSKELKRLE